MKTLIVYKGKYGATSQYAAWLAQELQLPVMESDEAGEITLGMCDTVIIGSSVYIGKMQVKDWLISHAKTLANKNLFFFIVSGARASEKKKVEWIIRHNIPTELVQSGNIYFLRGRLIKKKLSVLDLLKLKMGAMRVKDAAARAAMLADFDEVKIENLLPLINHVRSLKPERSGLAAFR